MSKNNILILAVFIIFSLVFFSLSFFVIDNFLMPEPDEPDNKPLSIEDIKQIYYLPAEPAVLTERTTGFVNVTNEIVPAGFYKVDKDTKRIFVTRTVSNERVVKLMSDANNMFGGSEIENLVFINNKDTKNHYFSLKDLSENPEISNVPYEIRKSKTNSSYNIYFKYNTSGYLCYTTVFKNSKNSIMVDDGARHIQISIPDDKRTGSYVFGRPIPSPSMTLTRPEEHDILMVWEDAIGVSVQYYNKNLPLYMTITFLILGVLTFAVIINHYLKIREVRKVMKYADPNTKSGFRIKRK